MSLSYSGSFIHGTSSKYQAMHSRQTQNRTYYKTRTPGTILNAVWQALKTIGCPGLSKDGLGLVFYNFRSVTGFNITPRIAIWIRFFEYAYLVSFMPLFMHSLTRCVVRNIIWLWFPLKSGLVLYHFDELRQDSSKQFRDIKMLEYNFVPSMTSIPWNYLKGLHGNRSIHMVSAHPTVNHVTWLMLINCASPRVFNGFRWYSKK